MFNYWDIINVVRDPFCFVLILLVPLFITVPQIVIRATHYYPMDLR